MTNFEQNQLNFINLRFGTFIHFNSATVQFHDSPDIIDWEYDHENGDQPRLYPFDPTLWNPTQLDTDVWADMAKKAGCRFAALTTKHHEGFSLWHTKAGKHSVAYATDKRDIVRMYLDSFRKVGIAAGLYFSILDLTRGIQRRKPFGESELDYIRTQITELLTEYGEIPFLMVDGWNSPWGGPSYKDLPFETLDAIVKGLQPHCLLLNIGCSDSLKGTDIIFYENAAGQEAQNTFSGPGISCNKLTDTWFHRDEDREKQPKSAAWVKEKADGYFPKNINFMLNISPDETGKVDPSLIKEFEAIGKLLTLPAPLTTLPEGWLTR